MSSSPFTKRQRDMTVIEILREKVADGVLTQDQAVVRLAELSELDEAKAREHLE